MDRYDPEVAPDQREWLALEEAERLVLVEDYHREARIRLPRSARLLHATIHTIVENQLAMEDQTIVHATLQRLMEAGLTRHEAIHAIGSVLTEHVYDLLHAKSLPAEGHAAYYAALEQLTVEKWRGSS